VDIKSYFDTVEPRYVREFLGKRVRDGVVKRMVGKWLDRRTRGKDMTWEKFHKLLQRYPIPEPRIVHRYT